jgi:hypothetical protein
MVGCRSAIAETCNCGLRQDLALQVALRSKGIKQQRLMNPVTIAFYLLRGQPDDSDEPNQLHVLHGVREKLSVVK